MSGGPAGKADDDDVRGAPRRLVGWFLREVDEVVDAALSDLGERDDDDDDHHERPAPFGPGRTAPPVSVPAAAVEHLTAAALSAAYATPGEAPPRQVIWHDAGGEVLVHLDQTKVIMFAGLVLVALTLESDETGSAELVVPFAVGSPDNPAGLVAVTEPRPRGPQLLVDRWAQAAIAAAWQALLDVSHGLALRAGVDSAGARLIPGAIATDGSVLSVTPQARFTHDRVVGR